MRNEYRIVDFHDLDIPSIEVYGNQFHYQDLYEIVGCKQYMTTFQLRVGSKSSEEFGLTVVGVINYDHKSLKKLKDSLINGEEISEITVRIDSPDRDLSLEKRANLKYRGLAVSDIEKIFFLPYKSEIEKHESGEKKVPNLIEIGVDTSGIDKDILNQNYLASKINTGTNLVQYEKE